MDLPRAFRRFIQTENLFQPQDHVLLAVSGGLDSSVLCFLFAEAGFKFSVAHCNFGLRAADSDRDEAFVATVARKYGVPFYSKTFSPIEEAKAARTSIEETARNLRYHLFRELSDEHGIALTATAHHADDNVETVLMNIFRGTGIRGLAGILPKNGKVIRPLLFARRAELEAFAAEQRIEYVQDETNFENDYTRNFFRNEVMPLIEERIPHASANVLTDIRRFREGIALYETALEASLKRLIEKKDGETCIPVFKLLKEKSLRTLLHEVLRPFGFSAAQTEDAVNLLHAESGKYILSAEYRLLKHRDWLIISSRKPAVAQDYFLIETPGISIEFPGFRLEASAVSVNEVMPADKSVVFVDQRALVYPLIVRRPRAGDYFYPFGLKKASGMPAKKKVSRFLSDEKLSPTAKQNVWVLESGKKILWVVGHRADERFRVTASTTGVLRLNLFPADR